MRRKIATLLLVVLVVAVSQWIPFLLAQDRSGESPKATVFFSNSQAGMSPVPDDEHAGKIIKQSEIEQEARWLEKQGRYKEAIAKYREATDPALLNYDYDAGVAIGGIERIYQKQGEFELALKELQWHLERNPEKYQDQKLELEALIKTRRANSPQPIYEHIEYLKRKYKNQLPPSEGVPWEAVVVAIIRLYDYIADFEGGIDFVEGFLKYYAARGPGNPYQPANPYFQVKQAFLQDKADGFKGCVGSPPGQVCMGKAAKALIQSDYFPW